MANKAEVQKMIAAFLRSGLSAREALVVLAHAEKAAAEARARREKEEFQKGLGLRNVVFFLIFVGIFCAIVSFGQ